jgi:hypothetical protein
MAWLRICRPGSVIGPQQAYLEQQEARMRQLGEKGVLVSFFCLYFNLLYRNPETYTLNPKPFFCPEPLSFLIYT